MYFNIDLVRSENIENSAKRWGTVCGFNAAEAFQIIRKLQM